MKILIIGLADREKIVELMKSTTNEELEFFYSENIKESFNDVNYYDIDIFVVDTQTNFVELKAFTNDIDYYMEDYVRGVFISNSNDYKTLVLAMNLGFIDGYIVRPYSAEDFTEMWKRYNRKKKI